jgi:tRNA isopentenyl-2-thiomethyl-A-37 hydroxylase MiaE
MIPDALVLRIPRSLQAEHEELRAALTRLANEPSRIGEAAADVASLFQHHAAREEAFALPLLGLLEPLAAGTVTTGLADAVAMARQLRTELPRMLEDHLAIVAALQILLDRANELGRPDVSGFAHALIQHAQTEEEVLYPAAILVGAFLEART